MRKPEKPLPPDTPLEGVCSRCNLCIGCSAAEALKSRNAWGDEQPAIKCPNPKCGAVIFLHRKR